MYLKKKICCLFSYFFFFLFSLFKTSQLSFIYLFFLLTSGYDNFITNLISLKVPALSASLPLAVTSSTFARQRFSRLFFQLHGKEVVIANFFRRFVWNERRGKEQPAVPRVTPANSRVLCRSRQKQQGNRH